MAKTSAEDAADKPPALSSASTMVDRITLPELSQAEMQALAEKVMALLKRDLRLERERLLGR